MATNISYFAKHVNTPLDRYLDSIQGYPRNQEKEVISFLSGDATLYGEKSFQMPQKGYQILREHALIETNHGYIGSSGTDAAKKAILSLYKSKVVPNASDVIITHGVNMGLLSVLIAFTNEGDQILVPEIGYPFFTDLCPAMKRKAISYKLKKDKNFEIDLEDVKRLVSEKTAFIYIINPANPTGSVFSVEHMKEILEFADQNQLPIVADEVYLRMTFPGVEYFSFGELTEDVPVISLCGMEKVFSVPGWVTAWTVIFDRHQYLTNVKKNLGIVSTIFLHTNTFTQHALPSIIEQVGLFTAKQMGKIKQSHDKLLSRIKVIPCLKAIPAQGTIYLSIEVDLSGLKDLGDDKQFARVLYLEESVNVLPLTAVGTALQGFRLLTCASDKTYDELCVRLKHFIQTHVK